MTNFEMEATADRLHRVIGLALKDMGITMKFEFIPYSKSRNAKKGAKVDEMGLNYLVTLFHKGVEVLTTDYDMGIAHCPSYVASFQGMSVDTADKIKQECETGRSASKEPANKRVKLVKGQIVPDVQNVVHCLLMDGEADDMTFEEWCGSFGYDEDSRKAEKLYKACRDIGQALRLSLGRSKLDELKELFNDY